MTLAVQVRGMLGSGRLGWVMGKYSRGLMSSVVLEGCPRGTVKRGK